MTQEEYNIKSKMLLSFVPKQYREGCKKLAWDLGHANGYQEVSYYLQDIVDNIFKK